MRYQRFPSQRKPQDGRGTSLIPMDARLDAEDTLNCLDTQHLDRGPISHELPLMQQDETMKPAQCEAEIVDDGDHPHSLARQPMQEPEDLALMRHIEVGRRFIE